MEQRTGLQIREDLRSIQQAEAKKPMHTDDIHILNNDGHEVWMRVTAVPLGKLVGPALREAERATCPNRNFHDGVRPSVLEQHGRPRDHASALGAC